MNSGVGYGLLQNFGLKNGAVAGTNEDDMQRALAEVEKTRAESSWFREAKLSSKSICRSPVCSPTNVPLSVVAEESTRLKKVWTEMGCTLPFMGFNLLPLSVIPEIRLTDKGLVTVPGMEILSLFEEKKAY